MEEINLKRRSLSGRARYMASLPDTPTTHLGPLVMIADDIDVLVEALESVLDCVGEDQGDFDGERETLAVAKGDSDDN